MALRSYQELAITQLRSALAHHSRALLVMPTGSGKTVVFSEICRLANIKGSSVLILVHRRELVKQASDKLSKAGVEHGIIAAGFKPSAHSVQPSPLQRRKSCRRHRNTKPTRRSRTWKPFLNPRLRTFRRAAHKAWILVTTPGFRAARYRRSKERQNSRRGLRQ